MRQPAPAIKAKPRLGVMEITELPCGLVVDLAKGECCLRSCPHEWRRQGDHTDRANPIERCYHTLDAVRWRGVPVERRRQIAAQRAPAEVEVAVNRAGA